MRKHSPPVIAHVVHSLVGGGTERSLVALLHHVDHQRFRHVVITLREAGPLAAQLPDSVACRPIGAAAGRARTTWLKLRRVLGEFRPSVLHARNTCCWTDAWLASLGRRDIKLVMGFHGLDIGTEFEPRRKRVAWLAARTGAQFVSVSNAGRQLLEEQILVAGGRISVLRNGVDLGRFRLIESSERIAARDALGFTEVDLVIGSVGSLTPVKDFARLVDAVAALSGDHPSVRLLIVGDGPLRRELSTRIARCGLTDRARLVGASDAVPEMLAAMDVYVCSSMSEGVSNAMLEAMARGLPVVSAPVGDHADILQHGECGLVDSVETVDGLSTALLSLVRNPLLRRELGLAAHLRVAAWNMERSASDYDSYYAGLAAMNPCSMEIAPDAVAVMGN